MARHKKPSAMHELSGAYDKNPNRRPVNEPEPEGELGQPPLYLNFFEQEIWNEIARQAAPGVLTSSDRLAVEMATRLMHEFRTDYATMPAARLSRLETLLARFGMTPADRSRIGVKPKDKPKNPYDAIGKAH